MQIGFYFCLLFVAILSSLQPKMLSIQVLTRIATEESRGGRKFSVPDKSTLENLCEATGMYEREILAAFFYSCESLKCK